MILTEQILIKGKSSNGGWSMAQLSYLGIEILKKGWMQTIIGCDFPEENIRMFLELKDQHLPNEKIENKRIYEVLVTLKDSQFDRTNNCWHFTHKGFEKTSPNQTVKFYADLENTTKDIPLYQLEDIEISIYQ
jgi:tRNA A22 N-methylase